MKPISEITIYVWTKADILAKIEHLEKSLRENPCNTSFTSFCYTQDRGTLAKFQNWLKYDREIYHVFRADHSWYLLSTPYLTAINMSRGDEVATKIVKV